jgi:hypothetical protein
MQKCDEHPQSCIAKDILVGLTIPSLNQFAEHVAQAEALSAEVAIILKGLQAIGAARVGAAVSPPMTEEGMENAGMARL